MISEMKSNLSMTPKENQRLDGRVVFITGAGSVGEGWGNGRSIAVRFAQEGAKVFGVDLHEERMKQTKELIESFGGIFVGESCDVMSSESISQAVQKCVATFGRIDVLVNNVGGSAKGGPVEMSEDIWDTQVDYNLKSVFLTCKHVLPHMIKHQSGAVISMASTSGTRWTGSAQIAYAATKAGIIQMSKVLAVQYAQQSIRFNTVVPGQLHTPMVEVRLAGQRSGGDVQALLDQRQSRIPLPFMGDGRDSANAALFFACDESRFVTGTEIVVDGGMSARCD
jgi:NAD(P)-dependent dehydrogenase (short-subunit alcohol dehydrogenase family)